MPLPPPTPARLTRPDGPPASPPGRGSPAEPNPPPQVVSHPPPPVAAAAAAAWIPSSPQGPWGKPYSSALYDGAGIVTLAAPEAEAAAGTSAAELLRQQRQRREQEMWLLSPSKQKAHQGHPWLGGGEVRLMAPSSDISPSQERLLLSQRFVKKDHIKTPPRSCLQRTSHGLDELSSSVAAIDEIFAQ
eukprot:EG_transcript_18852